MGDRSVCWLIVAWPAGIAPTADRRLTIALTALDGDEVINSVTGQSAMSQPPPDQVDRDE